MAAPAPQTSLDKLFGDTETKGRDSKADLQMLQKELGSYTVEQVAGLSETEGSAVKEFADSIRSKMNSPQDCVDLFEATQAINRGWASLTGGPALAPAEQKKITECAQAIIVTQLRAKGMNLSINATTKAITVVNEPSTWTYGGMTETLFIKNLGLDTAPAAQKAVDESEYFIRQAQAMAARRPGATAPGTLAITSTPPAPTPGIKTRIGDTLDTHIITPLKNARTEHPELFWGGSIVAGSLALFGIYKLFSGKKAPRATAAGSSGSVGSSTSEKEKGFFSAIKTGMGETLGKFLMTIIGGAGIEWGGYEAYTHDAFGVKTKVETTGTKIKENLGKWIRELIPGLSAAPTVPGVPVIPPLPGMPGGRPIDKIPGTVTEEQLKVRKKTISDIEDIQKLLVAIKASEFKKPLEILAEKTPQDALTYFHSDVISKKVPADISEVDYKKVEEILSRGVALEEATIKANAVPGKKLALDATPGGVDPTSEKLEKFLQEKITGHNIKPETEWADNALGDIGVEKKLDDLKKVFKKACEDDADATKEDSHKKDVLKPIWRKIIYDICMKRAQLYTGTDAANLAYINELKQNLDNYILTGSFSVTTFFTITGNKATEVEGLHSNTLGTVPTFSGNYSKLVAIGSILNKNASF